MATCSASLPDLDASGDALYGRRVCRQPFVDWAWDAYELARGDWDRGFGHHAVCDVTRPLGRTLTAIWCLSYSAADWTRESYGSNILQWGGRFARNAIVELDARCGDGETLAATCGEPGAQGRTELYLPFFYGQGVALRAGTLIHQARHADGRGHDRGARDSSWEHDGPWRWQVAWLARFAEAGARSSPAQRAQARQRANNILNSRFERHPGFNV